MSSLFDNSSTRPGIVAKAPAGRGSIEHWMIRTTGVAVLRATMLTNHKHSCMNYRLSTIFVMTTFALLAGCASQPPINKSTASGKPEVLVKESAASAIRAKLLEKCAMRGMQVEEQQSTVSCTKTLDGAAGIAAQMMLGNSYSTTPTQRTTFLVTQRGADTFVMMTSSAISTQMTGGQVKSQEVSNNGLINEVQTFLDNLQN